MTTDLPTLDRRTTLRTLAASPIVGLAGCLGAGHPVTVSRDGGQGKVEEDIFGRIAVEGTELVVTLSEKEAIDELTIVQPDGGLFERLSVPAGTSRFAVELGTSYLPGEYRFVGSRDDDPITEARVTIRPDLEILDVGLYRNRPEKAWDEVYGPSETNRRKNGEAFVSIENVGTGPDAVLGLRFTGDVPNLADEYRGSGLYGTERVIVGPGETVDLFSETFPFGAHLSDGGMGCQVDGANGEFAVLVDAEVQSDEISRTYAVRYSGSEAMQDCTIEIDGV